ncbi:DNA topoisomerase IV subunit B [Hyphobacterium marinum]|uniref:DNA topoisomerase 4 subunit B n=1 Tax=Hyphobacterium marinum TaxID=3116574 RepID=A0ABU7M190_9PROT|nr:DNA topoisomerase IV subunit B [Hyphobacterium sp. Y6023]MEE2567589.1 DNA topoisomerase IV subunit B [Hyphobacterium sp. Y6023]
MTRPSAQSDLFGAAPAKPDAAPSPAPSPAKSAAPSGTGYDAEHIEVLEGLEAVRRRPGMYIGGTDDRAMHHLFAEVLDNSMDEAVAGWADRIEVRLDADGFVTVTDNGRGIPVDPHPKFKDQSALEVVLTTLHAGGKFSDKAYKTAGGLHGVGVSVVNALSDSLVVEVARERTLYRQSFSRGLPQGPLETVGPAPNRRGTSARFRPDPQIFGEKARLRPARLFAMARTKAFLRRGVEIRWKCAPELVEGTETPAEAVLSFPGGLADRLAEIVKGKTLVTAESFSGRIERESGHGGVEWAVTWSPTGFGDADGFTQSFCNTVPTPQGGTHEQGLRNALTKGVRAYAEIAGIKKGGLITPDDVLGGAGALVSVFVHDPEFQGQTKDRLATPEAARLVETAVRDRFDHWLAGSPKEAERLIDWCIERAEDRLRRRKEKQVKRQTAARKLRLPGKLSDCSRADADGTELFLVEGDSAGGSAKQARNRETQAILPLRGKILNVASASLDKIAANQEISDLQLAMGCGTGSKFNLDDLRYERIIIMTDADVDGAHIAALLITFFYTAMPALIESGRLFMAQPPLYKLTQGGKNAYARDEAHRDALIAQEFKSSKVDISRFKGLGEMTPAQLKTTTMDPKTRQLARVTFPEAARPSFEALVETLMGRKAELRFQYIQEHAPQFGSIDV